MRHVLIYVLTFPITTTLDAAVVEFTDKTSWTNAAGIHSTITFAELPLFTLVTNQYEHFGVRFTDGSDYTHGFSFDLYPKDGYGLNGAVDSTTLQFLQPMYSIAIDFPGAAQIALYYQGQLTYVSSVFGGGGIGWFGGLISDQPFDKVFMYDPEGGFFIDDLHFGPAIPAPGALALAVIAGVMHRRRRRLE